MEGSGNRTKNSNTDRHYEPIWKELKSKKKVVLSLTPLWHPRVKKAVCKEKNMDYGYKLECEEESKGSELTFTSNGGQLTITLYEIKLLRLENL